MSSFEFTPPSAAAANAFFAYDIDKVKIPFDFFAGLADHVVNKLGARAVLVSMNVADSTDRVEMEAAA